MLPRPYLESGPAGPVAVAVQLFLALCRAELLQLLLLQLVRREVGQELEEGAPRHAGDVQVVGDQVPNGAGLWQEGREGCACKARQRGELRASTGAGCPSTACLLAPQLWRSPARTHHCTNVLVQPTLAAAIAAAPMGPHSLLLSPACFSSPQVGNRESQWCGAVPYFMQVL